MAVRSACFRVAAERVLEVRRRSLRSDALLSCAAAAELRTSLFPRPMLRKRACGKSLPGSLRGLDRSCSSRSTPIVETLGLPMLLMPEARLRLLVRASPSLSSDLRTAASTCRPVCSSCVTERRCASSEMMLLAGVAGVLYARSASKPASGSSAGGLASGVFGSTSASSCFFSGDAGGAAASSGGAACSSSAAGDAMRGAVGKVNACRPDGLAGSAVACLSCAFSPSSASMPMLPRPIAFRLPELVRQLPLLPFRVLMPFGLSSAFVPLPGEAGDGWSSAAIRCLGEPSDSPMPAPQLVRLPSFGVDGEQSGSACSSRRIGSRFAAVPAAPFVGMSLGEAAAESVEEGRSRSIACSSPWLPDRLARPRFVRMISGAPPPLPPHPSSGRGLGGLVRSPSPIS